MAKMMILGVKGEAGLWLVDFEAGTVTAMDGDRSNYISTEASVEFNSADIAVPFGIKEEAFSGLYYKTSSAVDIAAPFDVSEEAFSGHYYKTPSAVDVAVPFNMKEEAFSGQYYKTPPVAGKHSLQS